MGTDARQAPPSSPSSEEDEGRELSVKPSLKGTDQTPSSKKKTNKDAPAQPSFKLKRHGEEPFQESKKKKRSKRSLDKSGIDLEELLAQTYHKEISAPVESPKQTPTEGSGRRSNRKKKRTAKIVSDSTKKWSGDEETSLSMALLECTSPEGEISMAAFYQRAKESLHDEVSNSQLYDKMRTMKKRFLAIQAKLREHNIAEDEFPYRTHHQSDLFKIWKQIWGNNGDNHGNHSENLKENGVQGLSEFENPRENVVETPKEIENENPRGNGGKIRNENSMEIADQNPGEYDAETPRERGAENPMVNDNERENSGESEGGNRRGIESENSGDIGSESPIRNEVSKPRGSEVEKEKEGEERNLQSSVSHEKEGEEQNLQSSVSHEKEGEEQNLQKSVSHETQNIEDNIVCKLLQSGRFEDNVKILLEKTESRLQASIESSINRFAVASASGANFQPFGGFGPDMGMGDFLSRRMKELMDGLNSVKGLPGLDSVEARELQQKWHALKIQEVRMFCETLDLLQKQCRLLLKNAESSDSTDNHGS